MLGSWMCTSRENTHHLPYERNTATMKSVENNPECHKYGEEFLDKTQSTRKQTGCIKLFLLLGASLFLSNLLRKPLVVVCQSFLSFCQNVLHFSASLTDLLVRSWAQAGLPLLNSWGWLWTPDLFASLSQILEFIGMRLHISLSNMLYRASDNIWFIFDLSDNALCHEHNAQCPSGLLSLDLAICWLSSTPTPFCLNT